MKIGIIGTRGIPNRYGGFEQFAEYAAPLLVQKGHEVTVYNSSLHPYKETQWNGVEIVVRFDPEDKIGTAGQFIYDLNCILHARKQNFDIILQLGYTSSSIWSFLFPKKSKVVTNMDGLEWKRSKYSKPVQQFLKYAERLAATKSTALIADSPGIAKYLKEKYKKESYDVAYGAELFKDADVEYLKAFHIEPFKYYMLIARAEPENNIEPIIKGFLKSNASFPLLIVGNYNNGYGTYLQKKYKSEHLRFTGGIYDINLLNQLRFYSLLYFHGHSVGGTNPSLLEAMASGALIAAHDNVFNKSVTLEEAFYFSNETDVSKIIKEVTDKSVYTAWVDKNFEKINSKYKWSVIANKLEESLFHVLEN
jgi:hypothetical protein